MSRTIFVFNPEHVPAELKAIDRWVCWYEEIKRDKDTGEILLENDGSPKTTKEPYNARTGKLAKSTDPSTWVSYREAVPAMDRDFYHGVGFVLNGDGVVGCDLDHCVSRDGTIAAWARDLVSALPTYWEISPSGEGLRGFCRGKLPPKGRKKGAIEFYETVRFLTTTGAHLAGTPSTIEDCSTRLLAVHHNVFGASKNGNHNGSHSAKSTTPVDLDDSELLAKAFDAKNGAKFKRLWKGDRSDFSEDKAASDLALCVRLSFWTGRDASRIEDLFNQSELVHASWTSDDRYRQNTIQKAIDLTDEIYTRPPKPSKNGDAVSQPEPRSEPINDRDEEKSSVSRCSDELILDPADPVPTAREFVKRYHLVADVRALQHQAGLFYQYSGDTNAYADMDEDTVRARLYAFLEPAKRWTVPKNDKEQPELVDFKPTKGKVENALDALRAVCNLPANKVAPCWLESSSSLNALDVMACRNGLLHLPTRRLLEPTPRFFTLNGIDFAFDRTAIQPVEWLKFLRQLWDEDSQSIETLQEWIGYLLTPRTHLQKILMLVGPKRSGKGTIGRVIRMLLGARNVCGPTLANMGEQFGLSVLIGKSTAIVADARISGRTDTAVVTERLLSISGEDTLSIPRKFLTDWNGKLSARFMLMTNELPRIEDASGALASRFIILTLSQSFYGREDHGLLDRFIPELPGILLWAIEGWERLNARGRFIQPDASAELIQQFEDLGSPIGAFIRERCLIGKAHSVVVDRLFQSWKAWCDDNGRERSGTSQAFGRNLRAAVPWLSICQPRVAGDRVRYYEGIRLNDEY